MQLGRIIPHINYYGKPLGRQSGAMHPLETAKGIFYNMQNLSGIKEVEFYINLINLFDEAIIQDNLHVLSVEQQKLLEEFFTEADKISPDPQIVLETFTYDFSRLPKYIDRLDEFLGSFLGEEDGQYSRYGKKQLHSKCKQTS